MRHDPERLAAAYLAGDLGHRRRERYESHLLECEQCWREVQGARQGRMLAESLREVAPPGLRERIRALAATPLPRRPPRGLPILALASAAATAIIAILVITGLILVSGRDGRQPPAITAAITAYQAPGITGTDTPATPPARSIGPLTWTATTRHDLAGLDATLYLYTDPAGHRLLVIRSPHRFPTARGARPVSPKTTSWTAALDGAALFCADQPGVSWLAIGPNADQVRTAGRVLGLR